MSAAVKGEPPAVLQTKLVTAVLSTSFGAWLVEHAKRLLVESCILSCVTFRGMGGGHCRGREKNGRSVYAPPSATVTRHPAVFVQSPLRANSCTSSATYT